MIDRIFVSLTGNLKRERCHPLSEHLSGKYIRVRGDLRACMAIEKNVRWYFGLV